MDYGLARMVLGSSAVVPISKSDYESIKKAKDGLLQCLFIEEKFDLVVENYLELETTLLGSVAQNMILGEQGYQSFQIERGLFNRRLVNLLTAGRSYVDHVMHHINNIFPIGSDEAQKVKAAFSQQYDKRIGYRAMEALRNFVQHRGLPVHSITHNGKWVSQNAEEKLLFAVSLYLHIDELRADSKIKKAVLRDLESRGDKIDLKSLFRDYVEGLWAAQAEIREHIGAKVKTWEGILNGAVTRYQSQYPEENSVIGLAAVIRDVDDQLNAPIEIFKDFIDYRKYLERKNRNLKNLALRYATSEVIDE